MFRGSSPAIGPSLVAAVCLLCSYMVDSMVCNGGIYGNPVAEDCIAALEWMPFAKVELDLPDSRAQRIFAEPQQMSPPFAALANRQRPRAIVQLPKIWKHSMLPHSRGVPLGELENPH